MNPLHCPRPQLLVSLFAATLLFNVCGTFTLPLIDRDEPRFAEASREMRARSDWIIPWFNNRERFDKPPLIYWAQIACYDLFGESDFAARLPSAIAGALTTLLILGFATRLYSRREGLLAAVLFALCLQVLIHAKAAVADMAMILFFTSATWAGWEVLARSRNTAWPGFSGWWWMFYVSLALGFLAKGPVAWLPLATLGIYQCLPDSPPLNRALRLQFGLPFMLAIVAAWGIPALLLTKGQFFSVGIGKHVWERSLAVMEGHGATGLPLYFATLPIYFLLVFISFAPWSIHLPGAVRHFRDPLKRNAAEHYLLIGIAVIFVVFSLLRTKLPHYTLPAFPMLAILLARYLVAIDYPNRSIKRFALGMLGLNLVLAFLFGPLLAWCTPSWQIARQVRGILPLNASFAAAEYQEPSLVWYLRANTSGWYKAIKPKSIPQYLAREDSHLCILPTSGYQKLDPRPDAEWKPIGVRGFNVARGKLVDLTMLVRPSESSAE